MLWGIFHMIFARIINKGDSTSFAKMVTVFGVFLWMMIAWISVCRGRIHIESIPPYYPSYGSPPEICCPSMEVARCLAWYRLVNYAPYEWLLLFMLSGNDSAHQYGLFSYLVFCKVCIVHFKSKPFSCSDLSDCLMAVLTYKCKNGKLKTRLFVNLNLIRKRDLYSIPSYLLSIAIILHSFIRVVHDYHIFFDA